MSIKPNYDALDRVTQTTQAKAQELEAQLHYTYTNTNTLEALSDPLGNTTEYGYDSYGYTTQQTNPDNTTLTLTREPQTHKIVSKHYQDNATVFYSYTQPNNLLNIISADDTTHALVYDSHQRLAKAETKIQENNKVE